jgi:hypothetical protein
MLLFPKRILRRPSLVVTPSGDRAAKGERMRTVMVRYRVKPDRAGENQRYAEKVFEELDAKRPEGLRYATFKLPDGVSFVHFAAIEAPESPLRALASFQAFTEKIAERCEEAPVLAELTSVGNYRLL